MADLINGLFEFIAGILVWLNVRAVRRDKGYYGVSLAPISLFALWGVWNLYYYPSLSQWWSFIGGINVVVANIVWVALMIHYGRKRKGE